MNTPDYVVTYTETPHYLTPGKRYAIERDFERDFERECKDGDFEKGVLYGILDDEADFIIIRVPECSFLRGKSWKKGYICHV